jgi:hypothetical protein
MSKEKKRTLAIDNAILNATSPADLTAKQLEEMGARLAMHFAIRKDVPFTPGELRDLGVRFSSLSRLLGLDGKSST